MKVSILKISCKGAHKPDNIGESIEFECLIEEINTGITVICTYDPEHHGWSAHFQGLPELEAIAQPDLDWYTFSCSGIPLCKAYVNEQNLYKWWAAYPIAEARKRLVKILGVTEDAAPKDISKLARDWIESQGLELWNSLPNNKRQGVTSETSPIVGKLFEVKATRPVDHPSQVADITVGLYEASSPNDAVNRCFLHNPRRYSKYRNWRAIELSLKSAATTHTMYFNLEGAIVTLH